MAYDLEEQEQLDDAKAWWKQHGNKVIWGVTVFLLAAAGWRAWETWQRNQAADASLLYDRAVQALSTGDAKTAKDAASQIIEKHARSAYAAQAAWLAGQVNLQAGDHKSALAQYQFALEHAHDAGVEQLARIRLAAVQLDGKDAAGALKTLESPFDKAYTGLAEQLKGDVLLALDKPAEARAAFKRALENLDDKSALKPLVTIRLQALGEGA